MIILYHKNNRVTEAWNDSDSKAVLIEAVSIPKALFEIARTFPDSLVLWCHESQREHLNKEHLSEVFHHKKIMASYAPSSGKYLPESIGYADESLFANPDLNSTFASWRMSSMVGGLHSSVLLCLEKHIVPDRNFDYFLHSLAKLAMPLGLLCYSEPRLLANGSVAFEIAPAGKPNVFRFVSQHYRLRWVFLLLLNFVVHEKKLPLFSFFKSFFYQKRRLPNTIFDQIPVQSSKEIMDSATFDVVIPSIGREKYLYDFLRDLSEQTLLPQRVIIVEQNPEAESQSGLAYLQSESWPFLVLHTFTHQAGACNARNLALDQVESEWIFLADDDIRISNDFLEQAAVEIRQYGNSAYTLQCLQAGEKAVFDKVFQWKTFGSGCSIVKRSALEGLQFDMRFEFGFGEDADFGMQLRKRGHDILYLPHPQIMHLKAPIGGFRTKPKLAWSDDKLLPKPSPTVMLYKLLHETSWQLNGYKTVSFFKFYKHQPIRNPFAYFKNFKARWAASLHWANKLRDKK